MPGNFILICRPLIYFLHLIKQLSSHTEENCKMLSGHFFLLRELGKQPCSIELILSKLQDSLQRINQL